MNNTSNFSGGNTSTQSTIHGTSASDPFYNIPKKESKPSETSFFATVFLHSKIQGYEAELQGLLSNKADETGTSDSISETRFRFLSLSASSIITVSLMSLVSGVILFLLFIQTSLLWLSYSILFLFLTHSFFPAYICYTMKRHTNLKEKKFTYRFQKKILNSWRGYEFLYILNIAISYFLSTLDWNKIEVILGDKLNNNSLVNKFYSFVLSHIDFSLFSNSFLHLTVALIIGLIAYCIMVFFVSKSATKEQKDIEFEYMKEKLRPIELARIKAGKYKI